MSRKKIVVIGGGFAGLQFVRNVDTRLFEILLIDQYNHHQFQPLFYQVATSRLEPSSISFPFRKVLQRKKNVQIRMAFVSGVDTSQKIVQTNAGSFPYDYLVVATGCNTNFFGNEELAQHALTLKSTYEAIIIRNQILSSFEKMLSLPVGEREPYLNIVIAGAGPTGVELAGAFAEMKKQILPKDYPDVDFSGLNIILVEGSPNTLNSMSKESQKASRTYLEEMGVRVMTEIQLKRYDGNDAALSNGVVIPCKSLIWAAGVTGNAIPGIADTLLRRGNRYIVDRQNKIKELDRVYAIGDIAYMETPLYPNGHPQLANVAINQAKNLAKNLKSELLGKKQIDFEYKDLGSMATVGKHKAVVDLPFFKFKGYLAWMIWMFLHLMLILSVKNKLIIFINWAWAYFTKDTSLRLILSKPEKK